MSFIVSNSTTFSRSVTFSTVLVFNIVKFSILFISVEILILIDLVFSGYITVMFPSSSASVSAVITTIPSAAVIIPFGASSTSFISSLFASSFISSLFASSFISSVGRSSLSFEVSSSSSVSFSVTFTSY